MFFKITFNYVSVHTNLHTKCSASTPGLFLVLFPGCALIANTWNNYVLDGFDVTSFEHLQLTWHMLRAIVGENVV